MNATRTTLLLALLFSTAALARNPVVLKITDGNNAGPPGDNTGPGSEQPTVVQSNLNGHRYITTVWMSSQVPANDAPYQCKCSTVEIDPLAGPRVIVPPVQLTNNNGDRPCNHPHMDINPLTNQILWSYGTNDPNQANVQPYVQGLDVMCNVTTNRVRIGNNNGNDGAPHAKLVDAASGLFQVGYLENNQRSRAVGITFAADNTITKLYNKTIVDPANIGRPSVERVSATQTLFCSANGDNRPPEIGVACALVNALDGTKIWDNANCDAGTSAGTCVIARSDPNANPKVYFNQPQVALGENGRFYVQVEKSNGRNNNNNRGATTTFMYTLLPDTVGPHTQNTFQSIGLNQVHATTCTGRYGPNGKLHAAVFDASITGSGFASAQMAQFDVLGGTLTKVEGNHVLGGFNGDSGYLANLYGQNPNTQGRDFMRCIGDIPNPGFGVTNGFLPSVKTFFAFPFAGRVPGEDKNSLFLSILPAEEPTPPPIVSHDLVVSLTGDGNGLVLSSPLGIDGCDGTSNCTGTFDEGVSVTLTAQPAAGSSFAGWSGDCAGAGTCVVAMSAARAVTANFHFGDPVIDPNDPVGLIVTVQGDGAGSVDSDPSGMACTTGTCAANFGRNQVVTLTATPDDGSLFAGWVGECTGTDPCQVTMSAARAVTATFNIDPNAPAGGNPNNPIKKPGVASCACGATDNNGSMPFMLGVFVLGLVWRRKRAAQGAAALALVAAVAGVLTTSACALRLGPPEPSIDVFSTVSATVTPGTPVELIYQVSQADKVTVSIAGGVDLLPATDQLAGDIFTPPLASSTTFVLVAHNQDVVTTKLLNVVVSGDAGAGGTAPPPSHASVVVFSPSLADVTAGDTATLSWQTVSASSGVILANDAVLTTIAADSIAEGSLDVTPAASTVYTLSIIGTDGQQVTLTTAINVSAVGAGPLTGRQIFDGTVQVVMQSKCGVCHEANNASGYPDLLGTGPTTYYDRLVADTRFVTALPENSLLLLKGEHTGPAFLPAEAQQVTAWLVKEATARGLNGGPVAPPVAGDFTPRSLAEALTRFGACMNRQVWDATYGAGNNTQVARQGTDQGQCMSCHSTGTAGSFLSASSGDTFDMNRIRPYVLKLVLSTANSDGSFKDLVPAKRYELKGSEGGDHPSYLLTQDRLNAINSFVDQTLVSFHDYTKQCQ